MLLAAAALLPSFSHAQTFVELGRTNYSGSIYMLVGLEPPTPGAPLKMDPFEAEQAATFYGGWLMAISNRQEEVAVVEALRGFRPDFDGLRDSDLWIGLNDKTTEGFFEWDNGEPLNYLNWNDGEPNDGGSGEDRAEITNFEITDVNDVDYISWNDEEAIPEFDNYAIVEMLAVAPPVELVVDPATGLAEFRASYDAAEVVSIRLSAYELVSPSGAFDVARWEATNLAARDADAIDPAAEGQRWEPVIRTPGRLVEAFLLGGSELAPGETLFLGDLFAGAPGQPNLTLNYTVEVDFADPAVSDGRGVLYERATIRFDTVNLPGDYTRDGRVDAADFTAWRDTRGAVGVGLPADGDRDGTIDDDDLAIWRQSYGLALDSAPATTVPEPTAAAILLTLIAAARARKRETPPGV